MLNGMMRLKIKVVIPLSCMIPLMLSDMYNVSNASSTTRTAMAVAVTLTKVIESTLYFRMKE